MRVISEEKLIKLAFRIDDHNTVVSLDDALAECQELQEPWMTLDEFLKSGFRGVCFVFTEPYTILCERTNYLMALNAIITRMGVNLWLIDSLRNRVM